MPNRLSTSMAVGFEHGDLEVSVEACIDIGVVGLGPSTSGGG
jgi:hypothetical protein